jgi:NADPH-dependent 2,4-dienoyl-CoA reductase/sulfur reductase-like enzyme
VRVRHGLTATRAGLESYKPDFAIVATGAVPRPGPIDVSRLDAEVTILHAWDFLADPQCVPPGSRVTIVGGGMVGMEVADLLATRRCSVTVVEALATVAQGMARNNRMELIERVAAMLDAAQIPYEFVGDCYRPGDFLAAIRDAWMVALSMDRR